MVSWGNLYSKGQQEGKTICFAESGAPDKMRLEQAQIRSTPPIMENPIKQTPPIRQMKLQAFTRSSLWVRRYQAQASLDRRLAAIAAALVAMAVPAESALLTHLSLDTADGLTLNGDAAITTGGLGKFGEALTLDGTGDWADVAANNPVTGGAVRTVSAWVFQVAPPTVTNKIATVIGIGTNNTTPGGQKWDFEIDNAFGGIEVGVGGGRNAGTGLTESELTGNWMLLVSTLPVAGGTVGDVKTYWNGAVTNAGTGTKLIDTVGAKFDLGVSANGSLASQPQHLNGRIDDVAIWNEALTTDEIKGLYEVGNSSELSYTAGNFDQVKQVHDAALGSVVVGSTEWTYATGLTARARRSGGHGADRRCRDREGAFRHQLHHCCGRRRLGAVSHWTGRSHLRIPLIYHSGFHPRHPRGEPDPGKPGQRSGNHRWPQQQPGDHQWQRQCDRPHVPHRQSLRFRPRTDRALNRVIPSQPTRYP
jgi:hypothetical protein